MKSTQYISMGLLLAFAGGCASHSLERKTASISSDRNSFQAEACGLYVPEIQNTLDTASLGLVNAKALKKGYQIISASEVGQNSLLLDLAHIEKTFPGRPARYQSLGRSQHYNYPLVKTKKMKFPIEQIVQFESRSSVHASFVKNVNITLYPTNRELNWGKTLTGLISKLPSCKKLPTPSEKITTREVQELNICGLSGSLQDRIDDCDKTVGKRFQIVSHNHKGYIYFLDTQTNKMWTDIPPKEIMKSKTCAQLNSSEESSLGFKWSMPTLNALIELDNKQAHPFMNMDIVGFKDAYGKNSGAYFFSNSSHNAGHPDEVVCEGN